MCSWLRSYILNVEHALHWKNLILGLGFWFDVQQYDCTLNAELAQHLQKLNIRINVGCAMYV